MRNGFKSIVSSCSWFYSETQNSQSNQLSSLSLICVSRVRGYSCELVSSLPSPHAHCSSSAILLSTCSYSIPPSRVSPGAGAWTDRHGLKAIRYPGRSLFSQEQVFRETEKHQGVLLLGLRSHSKFLCPISLLQSASQLSLPHKGLG